MLTARWRDGAQEREWLTQVWSLPRTLEPGDTATVPVRIPQPVEDGTYTVIWDLLLDRRAFFLESAGLQEPSIVEVVGSTIEAFEPDDVVRARPNPTRRQIWSWTGELFVERPWFGHGPGALRLVVGEVADTTTVIAPSHAHNLALEPLSAWGLIGAAPTLGLLAALLWSLRWLPRTTDLEGFATGAMLLAMLVHGAVEWALLFPSLGVIFALVAALWVLSVRGEVAR